MLPIIIENEKNHVRNEKHNPLPKYKGREILQQNRKKSGEEKKQGVSKDKKILIT